MDLALHISSNDKIETRNKKKDLKVATENNKLQDELGEHDENGQKKLEQNNQRV